MESFKKTYRNEDSILDQKYEKQTFIMRTLTSSEEFKS